MLFFPYVIERKGKKKGVKNFFSSYFPKLLTQERKKPAD